MDCKKNTRSFTENGKQVFKKLGEPPKIEKYFFMEEKHLYNDREKISLLVGTTMFRISKGYFLQRCEGASGVDILGHSVISEPGGVIVSGIVTARYDYLFSPRQ